MKRREFVRRSARGLAGLTIGAATLGKVACGVKGVSRPNFLIILADDAGWNDVGYHNPEIRTPHIDRLARQGVELDRFYACPLCSPTRAALLSGRHPSRFGILGPIVGGDKEKLPKDFTNLAAFLGGQGYRTAISGKWHLGLKPEDGPKQYGFEHSYGYLHGQIDPCTHLYKWGDKSWHRDDQFVDEEGHATDLITDEAVRFLDSSSEGSKPFFLYVAYSVPHFPLNEASKWLDHYPAAMNPDRRLFAASMTHMDAGIGRILAAVAENRLTENTLILFMSDNGGQENFRSGPDYYGNKFPPAEILGDNHPLRGWKGELYEGGIRVPACVCWPGRLRPRRVEQVVAVEDIYPTIAALLQAETDLKFDGHDVWRALQGGRPEERELYWRTKNQIAVRKGDWKIVHLGANPEEGADELYNLKDDPNETTNVIMLHENIALSLRETMLRHSLSDKV